MQKKTILNGIIVFAMAITLLVSCEKEDAKTPPQVSLKTTSTYTQSGDTVEVGRAINIGIEAKGISGVITNLVVKKVYPDGTYKVVMDTGMYAQEINLDKTFYQSIEDTAIWIVTVMDRNRMSAEDKLTIYKDPNSKFGGIIHYPSITLGYQNNTEIGQFLDLTNGKVYKEDSATIMQELIDVVMYYYVDDKLPSPTFSSPGEINSYKDKVSSYYPSVPNWDTQNYILWDISVDDNPISEDVFYNCHNDSLLIVGYDDVWGKMKFKWAIEGRVIPFMYDSGVNAGTRGMIHVLRADAEDTGSIEFEVKMQM